MYTTYAERADVLLGGIFEKLSLAIEGMEGKDGVKLMDGASQTYLAAGELVRLLVEAGMVTDLAGFEEFPPFFEEEK